MGEKTFKTELEIELEKALDERGIYLSLVNKEIYDKFRELDLAQYPEPPVPAEPPEEQPDKEITECAPEAVKEYKKIKDEEYQQELKEWQKKVGKNGILAWQDKLLELLAKELDDLAEERGTQLPFKISSGGVYKKRTAEIGDFLIVYGVVCNTENPEPAYNNEDLLIEALKLEKTLGEKREKIISINFTNQKYKETVIEETAKEVAADISKLRILKNKHKHKKIISPKEFVNDLMKLIGV